MEDPEATVRRRLLDDHREPIAATVEAARAVADAWEDDSVTDAARITEPLARRLRERGLDRALLALLPAGADALGTAVAGEPVTALPYLAVTGRGPVVRATLADGCRLVVTVAPFAVAGRRPARYRFRDLDPAAALEVELPTRP